MHARSAAKGSPPRMRGKAFKEIGGAAQTGITPAHAGKRCNENLSRLAGGDHPRACGEKLLT